MVHGSAVWAARDGPGGARVSIIKFYPYVDDEILLTISFCLVFMQQLRLTLRAR